MMGLLFEEVVVFIFFLVSVPALMYALQKLSKKKLFNKTLIVLIYVILIWIFFIQLEKNF